jgi:hypothetical protein
MVSYRTSSMSTKSFCLIYLTTCLPLLASPLGSIKSWFSAYPHEEVTHREYNLKPQAVGCSITIDQTLNGSVTITGCDENKISFIATKKAKKEEDIRTLAISVEHTPKQFSITTGYVKGRKKPHKACALDLEIFVPTKTAVTVDSIETVIADNIAKNVSIVTERGNISATNISAALEAQIDTYGNTTLENIKGAITTTTSAGNITILECHDSVFASTESGTINVVCAQTPSRSTIDLKTNARGTIALKLPEDTNASIIGNTATGKIVSTLPITLKGQTTLLNRRTYKQMPKSVQGIIGEEGNSEIKLSSGRGIYIEASRLTT